MKNIIVLCGIGLLMFLFYSCKSNPVDTTNITPVEVKPGSRNYTWDITTLDIKSGEAALLRGIWGSGPSDIWAVGTGSWSYYGAWHFNGSTWQCGTTESTYGQTAIWGSSPDNIWMGNGGGILFRYNGTKWAYYTRLKLPEYDDFCIQSIWGVSANEVYLIGAKVNGIDPTEEIGIFKFDGIAWKRVEMPKIYKNAEKIYKDKNGDLLFISSKFENNIITLYSWNGTELKTLLVSNNGNIDLKIIGGETIIVYENKMYKYNDGEIELLCDFNGVSNSLGISCGRSEKDIFGVYNYGVGKVFHYNGTDVVEVYRLTSRVYACMGCIFEKDVYILVLDFNTGQTKILHGKLNE
jgi:hypothetical protein